MLFIQIKSFFAEVHCHIGSDGKIKILTNGHFEIFFILDCKASD